MRARNGRFARVWVWGCVAACALSLSACIFSDREAPGPTPTDAAGGGGAGLPGGSNGSGPTATATVPPATADIASARALYREGRFDQARDAFEHVAAASTDGEERADALVGVATVAFELNDEAGGIAALEKAVGAAPAGSASGVRAAYLLVKHLNLGGDYAAAAEAYGSWAGVAGASPLGPFLQAEGASALAGAGRVSEARALWAALLAGPAAGAVAADVYRAQAGLARASGDDVGLVTALRNLGNVTDEPGVWSELSDVLTRAGDSAGAVEVMRSIVEDSPASAYAAVAFERLEAAGYAVDPGQAGLVYYRHGAYADAKRVLLPAVDEPGISAADLGFRAFYLGASYEDSGEPELAVKFYDVAASASGSAYVHRAMYWAARVTEEEGESAAASQRYVALVESGLPGDFREESAFRAGYVLYKSGDFNGALEAWEKVGVAASARLEYWRGRTLAALGRTADAAAAYRAAGGFGRFDFYALEASRELGEAPSLDVRYQQRDLSRGVSWAAIEAWLQGRIGGSAIALAPNAVCELASVGLQKAAVDEVWRLTRAASTWELFGLMREASECGLTSVAAQLAVRLRVAAGVASEDAPADLLRVAYPIDFARTLDAEAAKAGIDPLFLASLVRQESFWDPSAGSVAGALGLTQVIPATGAAIAAQLGVTDFEAADLFRPALSLEFGAFYLGGELRRYGDPLIALAAYNAGPGAAARWESAGAGRAADFVEVVDYVETQRYVVLIREAYAHYLQAWVE